MRPSSQAKRRLDEEAGEIAVGVAEPLEQPPGLVGAAVIVQEPGEVVPRHQHQARLEVPVDQAEPLADLADRLLVPAGVAEHPPLADHRAPLAVRLVEVVVDVDHRVEQLGGLLEMPLVAEQGGAQVEDARLLQRIGRAPLGQPLGAGESLRGPGEVVGDAAGVAEVGPGAGLEVLHDGGAVALGFEQAGEQEPPVGQLDGPGGVAEPLLEALLDQQLADGDRLQAAVEAEEDRPLLPGAAEQLGEQGGRLVPLGGGAGEPGPEAGEQPVPGGVLVFHLLARGGERAQQELVHLPLAGDTPRAQVVLDPALLGRGDLATREPLEGVPIRVTRFHQPVPPPGDPKMRATAARLYQ